MLPSVARAKLNGLSFQFSPEQRAQQTKKRCTVDIRCLYSLGSALLNVPTNHRISFATRVPVTGHSPRRICLLVTPRDDFCSLVTPRGRATTAYPYFLFTPSIRWDFNSPFILRLTTVPYQLINTLYVHLPILYTYHFLTEASHTHNHTGNPRFFRFVT